jgi:predicted  nucleic acid-binding Zn-ribbon protein
MEMETESASGDDNVELSHLIRDLEIESFSSSRIYDVSLSSQIAELFKRIIFELKTEEQEVNENEQCLKDKNLDHDISLEKACLKEKESIRAKDKLDRGKDGIEKRKDKGRKSEAILNYEQGRIKTVNDDLKKQSTEIESLNLEIVGPELDKKKLDVKVTKEESEASQKEIEKAATLSEELMMQLKEAESGHARLEELLGERENDERQISNEPSKLREELHGVQKSILDLKVEYQSLQENVSDYRTKILEQNSIRRDCITLRSDLEDKIQTCNRISTEEEQQYASISKDITMAQTKQHSHATTRLQLEIRLKESKESLRHQSNVTMLQKKQYDRIERVYVKKKYTLKKTIDLLAQMTLNLEESERHVRHQVKENEIQLKAIEDMKDEMNLKLTRWLEQENIEQTMKDELKSIAGNVEEKENETQKWRVEGGKLLKLLSITKIQRDTQIRKIRDVRTNAKETVEATKLKKLLVLDLAKVLLETNRRIEEFSALYEILKNERDEITSSTSEFSSQLLELHQKVKMQQTELQTLSNTKELKKTVLIKEKDAYESSRAQRATLRVEKTDVREIFRQKREEVDRQLVKVNRARAALSALKREQESLKNRNTRLRRSKKIMSKQLEDRKKDIHKLLQRANIYEEILKQGEVKIQEKKEDMRALVLQVRLVLFILPTS